MLTYAVLLKKHHVDNALSDAMVTGYENLVESLELPDRDDRHVLAAAIRWVQALSSPSIWPTSQ